MFASEWVPGKGLAYVLLGSVIACLAVTADAQHLATDGTFSVSDAGSATYEVAFSLPPNTGGHTALLGLTYRSQDGNGLFGVGWSMNGLSAITRCAKNPAEEGVRQGVQNAWGDWYCLDGQKLRLRSGTYGGDGATYATARDTYARVTSYGAAGSGPQWFKVELKDGRILEFGRTSDARLEVNGGSTVRAWMLNAAMDRSTNGNPIRYAYEKNVALGEQVLSAVQYTNGYVSIEYEARPSDDPIVRYDAGAQYNSTNRRAKMIRVYSEPLVNGVPERRLFKVYQLGYAQSGATRRSLLTSIQECNRDDAAAVCLPALRMSYQNSSAEALALTARPAEVVYSSNSSPIDIRGNGKLELRAWRDLIKDVYGMYANTFVLTAIWDYNSDGRMDVEGFFEDEPRTSPNYILISDGQTLGGGGRVGLSDVYPYVCRADLDGDGATDAIRVVHDGDDPYMHLDSWAGGGLSSRPIAAPESLWFADFSSYPCVPADFNGDGAAEAVVFWADGYNGLSAYTFGPGSEPNGLRATVFANFPNPLGSDNTATGAMRLGDFNGDGKTDVVSLNPWAAFLTVSNGRSLSTTALPGISLAASMPNLDKLFCTGDFNGDGRTDLYLFATRELLISTSTTFARIPSGIPAGAHDLLEVFHCADFDGDGRAEIYLQQRGQIWGAATPGPIDYLSEVSTGLGQKTRVAYKPITDDTVYTKGTGSAFPIMELQLPKYVVSRTLTSDGRGGFVPVSYTYAGLRADLRRTGMLGFARITTLNEVSGVGVETTYRQDHPFVGLRATVRKFRGSQTLEDTRFSYQAFEQTAQYARVHVSTIEKLSLDLDGSFISRTREQLTDIDAYGNARTQVAEHLDEAGTSVVSRQTLSHTYSNDSTSWLIGLLTGTTTSSQVSSASIPAAVGTSDGAPPGPPPSPPAQPLSPAVLSSILQLLLSDD